MIRAALALILLLVPSAARAETLVTSLSTDTVAIRSNFAGSEIAIFGVIEPDAASVSRAGGHDVVIVVTGPRRAIDVREKSRVFGLWVNTAAERFAEAPVYAAILSTRPADEIAGPALARRAGLTLDSLIEGEGPFHAALIRLKTGQGLYATEVGAITFLTPTVFQARVLLPPNVPIGEYSVETTLLSGSVPIATGGQRFAVIKSGVEADLTRLARTEPLAYGLATALAALFFGWLATVIFRRD